MFHARHFLLAARPRASTARRLTLFLLVFLSLAAGAPFAAAEMVYYTEDFCNEGEPGFDPMFNHELAEYPELPPGVHGTWGISESPSSPGTYILALFGTYDWVTFNTSDNERVKYAAVEILPYYASTGGDVTFIGADGTWQTSDEDHGKTLLEVSSSQIGTIQAIELRGAQLGCGGITIGTIPEPGVCLLLLSGAIWWMSHRMSRRRVC